VRIQRIRVDAFGRLHGVDTGEAPLPGVVVVLGPNEAGKSTLFHFLTSMIYGFYPATREGNPYAPWDGAEPSGALVLELDGGGCVDVERRLLSQPSGRLTVDGRTEDLRNRTLPWAEHVPRGVFRQVFALTLGELASLDEETWGRVQDRIVGAMGATDILPARHVVADLEQEAGELWRPTRRGNQRVRDLQDRIRTLRTRRREAAERDRRLREVVTEGGALRARLTEAREERQRAQLAVDRVQALLPVRRQLQRIAALREAAGDPDALRDLPPDPARALTKHRAHLKELEARRDELASARVQPQSALDAFGQDEQRLAEHVDTVSSFLARAAGLGGERARLAALEQESRDLLRRLETAAQHVLAVPWAEAPERALAGLPVAELRTRVQRLRAAREERRILEASRSSPAREEDGRRAPAPLAVCIAALAGGAALLGAGQRGGSTTLTALGAAVLAVGLVLLVLWMQARGPARPPREGAEVKERTAEAEASEREALGAVHELVQDLPLLPSLAQEPTDALVAGVERIQELLRDVRDRSRAAEELRGRVEDVDREAEALRRDLEVRDASDTQALALVLERGLRRAERLKEAAAAAGRELRRLDREAARLEDELRREGQDLDVLRRRLEEEGDGDVEAGARRVRERIQALERVRQLEDELERAHPDLDEIQARIARAERSGAPWETDEDDLARRRARVEALTDEVEDLVKRTEALEQQAAQLRDAETVDAVDGEIASLQEEEAALIRERDRRWAMAQLLRVADRRFREEHQPDLIRRAGRYLRQLTGGRYDRLVADEAASDGRFQLLGPDLPAPLGLAPPLSTGTLEQAYLALRFAIVDHLDQGHERLPLFVDEVFVNWDTYRRGKGMELLAGVAGHRQVFVFTCHHEVAHDLEGRGALVLPVGDDD
jgi:uncharacterized protein YhaN